MRLRRLAAGALAAALLLGACSASEGGDAGGAAREPDAAAAEAVSTDPLVQVARNPVPVLPVTVESADGRTVRVTDVSRIVSLWVNLSEVVYSIGLGENLVGRDVSTTFDEAEKVPLVTRAHDISAEGVLSLEPTVVLADTESGPPEAIAQLRAAGVPVVVFPRSNRVADIRPGIERVAAALGLPNEGRALADHTTTELATLQSTIPAEGKRPRVAFLYLRGRAGVYLLGGPGSGADSMIETAGGVDAGTAMGLDKPFTPITSEALVEAAPDVILTTTSGLESVDGVGGLVKTPGISQTPAGAARRIITEEDGLLYGFGARTPDALRELIRELYGNRAARR